MEGGGWIGVYGVRLVYEFCLLFIVGGRGRGEEEGEEGGGRGRKGREIGWFWRVQLRGSRFSRLDIPFL